jgi:hypothetical protein
MHRGLDGAAGDTNCALDAPFPASPARVAAEDSVSPTQCRHKSRPVIAMAGASLTGTDLYHWIALRRVGDGEVTGHNGSWRHHGHLVPRYVTNTLDELLAGGLLTLADPDAMADAGMLAVLTNAGIDRFEQLCLIALGVPTDQLTTPY